MNDKFLYQLHEEPNPEFAKNLHQKLTQLTLNSERKQKMNIATFPLTRKSKLAGAAILLVVSLALLMTFSPVRAFVESLLVNIAGQLFKMTDDYPGGDYSGDVPIIEPQILTLDDALAVFPHKFILPTYIPAGYALAEEDVRVYTGANAGFMADTIEITWLSDGKGITLSVTNRFPSSAETVAPNSVEEITLDADHPAVVIHGGWDVDKKAWTDESGTLRLRWLVDDLSYELRGADIVQLTEMALSTLK